MRIKLDYVPMEEPKVHHVDKWYDRHTRSWIIQLMDESDNQIGDAMYYGNRADADEAYTRLIKEYAN